MLTRDGGRETAGFLRGAFEEVDSTEIKAAIVSCMGKSSGPQTGSWLLGIVRDAGNVPPVRESALFWLGRKDEVPTADLIQLYPTFDTSALRKQAVHVIGSRQDRKALDFLLTVAADESDPEARLAAVHYVGRSKDPVAAEFLKSLLEE